MTAKDVITTLAPQPYATFLPPETPAINVPLRLPSSPVNHLGFYVVVVDDGMLFLPYYAAVGEMHRAYFDLRKAYQIAPDPHWSYLVSLYNQALQQWKEALNVAFAQVPAPEPPRHQKPVKKQAQKMKQPVKAAPARSRR